MKVTL